MNPDEIVKRICAELPGIEPKSSWGETSLFYNPGKVLPNGVYFCTIKEKDGANDKAANLDREGVFRLAIALNPKTYHSLFGDKPVRPAKGDIVATGHDFSILNQLMPHPIYAWMSWGQILSPSPGKFTEVLPLIFEAHRVAVTKFERKVAQKRRG